MQVIAIVTSRCKSLQVARWPDGETQVECKLKTYVDLRVRLATKRNVHSDNNNNNNNNNNR